MDRTAAHVFLKIQGVDEKCFPALDQLAFAVDPVEDGNLVDKTGRSKLMGLGLVDKNLYGNFLTATGYRLCLQAYAVDPIAGFGAPDPEDTYGPTRFRSIVEGLDTTDPFEGLVRDLLIYGNRGYCTGNTDRASRFLTVGHEETAHIGAALDALGGISKMREAHHLVSMALSRYAARELELSWSGIGKWVA